MANSMYAKALEKFLKGEISWNNDNIKAVIVDSSDYTPNLSTDEFLSAIASAGRVATSGNLTGKTTIGGVADADDVTFSSVTGDSVEYIVLYKDTGSASTSPLICIDDSATGLPCTPNGGDITITWDNTADKKIFKL
jgi:hypothetical protein